MTKLSKHDRHNIVIEYQAGATATRLSARYGIAVNYVYVLVTKAIKSGKIPPKKFRDREKEPRPTPPSEPSPNMADINRQAVRAAETVRRGFDVPEHLNSYYIQLLKQGKSLNDIKKLIGQKLKAH